ncbi:MULTISPECIES: SDR family NAD(P)-dependent oxidoreductase [unclassified Streptomyces]|uniref:SDR family NAD(P)-dependent oxidoreductase n=1 Tax=unclassified Streptomyces TaxID=2593676 RepID=UPI00336AC185
MALVLVTGASSGLGRDTANALAEDGHDVVIHVRNPARLGDGDDTARWKGVVAGDLAELFQTHLIQALEGHAGVPLG